MNVIICLILLFSSVFIIYKLYKLNNGDVIEGLNTFNGRQAIQKDYFYDTLFDDVYYYPNDEDPNGQLGMSKCLSECAGNCVEYGNSSNGYCFPY
jgi:hypothetical protein